MNAKEKILEKIIRVDQAGEVGAQQIYEGQKLVFKLFRTVVALFSRENLINL